MSFVVVYAIIVAYGTLDTKYPDSSYIRMANHIVGDYELNHPDIQSSRKYLEYVKGHLYGEEQMQSFWQFKKNFYAWARRRNII